MFCYLYVLFDSTNIPLYEKEKCFKECKFFKNDKCSIADKKSEKLSSDKYGWILQTVLNFKDPFVSKSGNTKYLSAVNLIHPSDSDIWIVECERFNKKTNEWYNVYRYHQSGDCTEFDDLDSLNKWMKKIKYDGRKISIDDFSINGV